MKDTTINIEETIQELNKQNKRIEELCLEIERLNNIINKGIKYIEKHYTIKKEETIYMTEDTKELLNILKGE